MPQRLPSGIANPELGAKIAADALALLGRPYRYGGSDPAGFDCSGLVYFVHARNGVAAPRTTEDQYRAARPVRAGELAAGDLVFFRIEGQEVNHVAVYVGQGRFVHAPQTGKAVEARRMDDAYFQPRLLGAARLY